MAIFYPFAENLVNQVGLLLNMPSLPNGLYLSTPVIEHAHDLRLEESENKGRFVPSPRTFRQGSPTEQRDLQYPWIQKLPDFMKPASTTPYCGSPYVDPLLLQLLTHYVRYLPYGLGPYGFYGNTGLPAVKPPGIFRATEKLDQPVSK